jgi:cytochrome o ubiquinol oxidase subunit 2
MRKATSSAAGKYLSSVPAKLLQYGFSLLVITLLSGCEKAVLLHPKGQVGTEEKDLIITTVLLMLIVVIPVMILTLFFAWRYRETNPKKVGHAPRWADNHTIELVVWGIPVLIVLTLAVIAWKSSHELDPYKPLTINGNTNVPQLNIDVVALDWKWLFIYPDQGVASLNKLVFPAHKPVAFHITSDAAMNSFFIPQLGGQIYAMAGMQTQLHLIADEPGTYAGISANFSGAGFADMRFDAVATPDEKSFDDWVAEAKASGNNLDLTSFKALASEKQPIPGHVILEERRSLKGLLPKDHVVLKLYGRVTPDLFKQIIGQYQYGHSHSTRNTPAMPAMSGAEQ